MHRGGGLGEGTDDLGPRRARRGRHRREAEEATEARQTQGVPSEPERYDRQIDQQPDRQTDRQPERPIDRRLDHRADRLRAGSRNGGRVGVTYKYFGAPDGATAARVPISMRPEELGGDELGMNGMFTKIKPETMAAMVLTGIEGVPLHKVPPLELVVLHPDYAVVKLPMTVVDPLRDIGEEAVGAAAFIWSTVPDRGGPRDAFNVYQLLHEWQDFSHRLHEAGHQPYCLVWP
ncbi:hypothetical protein SAMN05428944_4458 [Streptomyces sp. 1222.5]|nr:hypothetical protein BX260_3638 [Streptomyces sp. 5112.2]SEC63220.1 hypothetical protein SAMN05428944_4458 [Streptomyces sp. 1222.5]SED21595.1 hypothetical protein SAMN05216532_3824 [Streptomyces sp. 2231.1]